MSEIKFREMCPCCCGDGKSQIPQWQSEIITTAHTKIGYVYGVLQYQCQRSGLTWQTEHQKAMTQISKNQAIMASISDANSRPRLTLV